MADGFEPFTMEITKELNLPEADERAVARFRDEAFGDEDAILRMTLGPQLVGAQRIILWARWRQFVQRIGLAQADSGSDSPSRTEEVTRRYRIAPQ
jgi:hypothetical protein